jgi:hypothetical protein
MRARSPAVNRGSNDRARPAADRARPAVGRAADLAALTLRAEPEPLAGPEAGMACQAAGTVFVAAFVAAMLLIRCVDAGSNTQSMRQSS